MKKVLLLISSFFFYQCASAMVIKESSGANESLYVIWKSVENAKRYDVYFLTDENEEMHVVDAQLSREYEDYWRVDIPGLKAGIYKVNICAIGEDDKIIDQETISDVHVIPYVREGFAFADGTSPGAYNTDGTLKENTRILYVTKSNANSITIDVQGQKTLERQTGLCGILTAYGKGYDKTPLCIRILGTLSKDDVDGLNKLDYLELTGANTGSRILENVTIEGIGIDATLTGGIAIHLKRTKGIEIRNLGIMLFTDDAISMENDNFNIWIHNCDFFYGAPGSDDDQEKGDGCIDMKYNTTNITISHNHFWDSGKCTFAGGATESNPIYFTYHHNWFDHCDSRCPRLCHATAHIYNNYMDGNPTMDILSTENTSAFVEANHFRNCPYPMEINMQGSNYERWPDGTQDGGLIKAYNNKIDGAVKLYYQTDRPNDFDAYLVASREEIIPNTVVSRRGGNTYSNFDTSDGMYDYLPDSPDDVAEKTMKSAGRLQGGDIKWTFNNTVDDADKEINAGLKSLLLNYKSGLLKVQDIDSETPENPIPIPPPLDVDEEVIIDAEHGSQNASNNLWTSSDGGFTFNAGWKNKTSVQHFKITGNGATLTVPSNVKVLNIEVTAYSASSDGSALEISGCTTTAANPQISSKSSTEPSVVVYKVISPEKGQCFVFSNVLNTKGAVKEMEIIKIRLTIEDDETTSITENSSISLHKRTYYNINGMQVNGGTKGLVISYRKKYLINN